MFQLFYADVVKIDRDVAYVAMVVHVCCKCLSLMFHLFLYTYVASVSDASRCKRAALQSSASRRCWPQQLFVGFAGVCYLQSAGQQEPTRPRVKPPKPSRARKDFF
jgi:hypothetical protein